MRVGNLKNLDSSTGWAAASTTETVLSSRPDRRVSILTAPNARRLASLAQHLPERDHALIRAICIQGTPIRVVAELRRESERECRRTLAALMRRVNSPAFAIAVQRRGPIRGEGALIARACIVEGLTVRQAATRFHKSLYAVRRERDRILAMVECLKLADQLTRPARRRRAA